jgi:hypothetical protein
MMKKTNITLILCLLSLVRCSNSTKDAEVGLEVQSGLLKEMKQCQPEALTWKSPEGRCFGSWEFTAYDVCGEEAPDAKRCIRYQSCQDWANGREMKTWSKNTTSTVDWDKEISPCHGGNCDNGTALSKAIAKGVYVYTERQKIKDVQNANCKASFDAAQRALANGIPAETFKIDVNKSSWNIEEKERKKPVIVWHGPSHESYITDFICHISIVYDVAKTDRGPSCPCETWKNGEKEVPCHPLTAYSDSELSLVELKKQYRVAEKTAPRCTTCDQLPIETAAKPDPQNISAKFDCLYHELTPYLNSLEVPLDCDSSINGGRSCPDWSKIATRLILLWEHYGHLLGNAYREKIYNLFMQIPEGIFKQLEDCGVSAKLSLAEDCLSHLKDLRRHIGWCQRLTSAHVAQALIAEEQVECKRVMAEGEKIMDDAANRTGTEICKNNYRAITNSIKQRLFQQ